MDAQVNKGHGSARYSGLEMMQMMHAFITPIPIGMQM